MVASQARGKGGIKRRQGGAREVEVGEGEGEGGEGGGEGGEGGGEGGKHTRGGAKGCTQGAAADLLRVGHRSARRSDHLGLRRTIEIEQPPDGRPLKHRCPQYACPLQIARAAAVKKLLNVPCHLSDPRIAHARLLASCCCDRGFGTHGGCHLRT